MIRLLLAALAASGCTFGIGSTYVGQWRGGDQVDHVLCVEDATGACASRREIVSHVEPRRFSGLTARWSLGVARLRRPDEAATALAAGAVIEYLVGRGARAYGLSIGSFLAMPSAGDVMSEIPLTASYHLGLSDRYALRLGAGWSPLSTVAVPGTMTEVSHVGGHGLAALTVVLLRTGETRITVDLEARRSYLGLGGGTSASYLTATFGLHL